MLAAAIAISLTTPGQLTGVATAGPCQRTVGIVPQVSSGEGGGTLTFAVFSNGCPVAGTVSYETREGSADEGKDYKAQAGVLHWNLGEVGGKLITVPIEQDLLREDEIEDFSVRLTTLDPAVLIVRAVGQGRILDDEAESLLWSVDDRACVAGMPDPACICSGLYQLMPYEPNCSSPQLDLSAPHSGPTVVHWVTLPGSALPGLDYIPVSSGVLTLTAGQTTGELRVRLIPRPGAPRRHLYVQITSVSAGKIVDDRATIFIHGT